MRSADLVALTLAGFAVCLAGPSRGQAQEPSAPAAESRLRRLHPEYPLWMDLEHPRLLVSGVVCLREGPLEMFACLEKTKEHESIVALKSEAFLIHGALLALGVEQGQPVQFAPEYRPPTGGIVDVYVYWRDEEGRAHRVRGQDWVRHAPTGAAMEWDWVFAGSGFWKDENTGLEHYLAEGGDVVCVSNFTTALLDVAAESSQAANQLVFEAFTEQIPPIGTPVTVAFEPRSAATAEGEGAAETP